MSTRTIIEINHDCLGNGSTVRDTLQNLVDSMPYSSSAELKAIARETQGVRVLAQRHHSDPSVLTIAGCKVWED